MIEHTPERDHELIEFADTLPVYFAYSEEARLVKIGFSSNIRTRINGLNTASQAVPGRGRVVLIGWLIGGPALESELHEMFDEYRVDGEWFTPSPEMASVINEYGGKGEPPIVQHRKFRVTTTSYWGARRRLDEMVSQTRVVHRFPDGTEFVTQQDVPIPTERKSMLRPVEAVAS